MSQDTLLKIFKGDKLIIFTLLALLTVTSTLQRHDIRLSLLGLTGSGKSTTGNVLLNKYRFKTSGSSNSETFECSDDDVKRDGRNIKVVDTPGFLDTRIRFADLQERIIPFLGKTSPGPHALFYVMEAGRFTDEQKMSIDMYLNMFGEGVLKYTVVVFTKLPEGTNEMNYMNDPHPGLQLFLEQCGLRYVFLPSPNKTSAMETKINQLYDITDKMIAANDGTYYTDKMFKAQQKILEEKLEEQRQRQIKEKEAEVNAIKSQVTEQYKEIIETLENDVKMSKQERDKHEANLKALQVQMTSYDQTIKNLQNKVTLGHQRIADLSRQRSKSICLGPLCISW